MVFSHDNENRRLKTNLCHLKNELVEYQLKCEQLEKNNKQIEIEKTEVLEKIARSWGHYNAKQKIKYTERLIKDTDTIIQVTITVPSVKNLINYLIIYYLVVTVNVSSVKTSKSF